MFIKYILIILLCLANVGQVSQQVSFARSSNVKLGTEAPQHEQLIVFINSQSPILNEKDINALKKLADDIAVDLNISDIAEGAPKEVTYTPSIVFQNYSGRSFYYGRYKKISRIKNFVRTARLAHQADTEHVKKDILVLKNGRTAITAPIKLTELSGKVPKGFDQADFMAAAKVSVAEGMSDFKLMPEFAQTRTTRSFYFNLYPYLDGNKLTVSAEVFSQYNCVKPVFQKFGEGLVSGSWRNRNEIFQEAGQLIETEIERQISNLERGDALSFVPDAIPMKTWTELGLDLPEKPTTEQSIDTANLTIPQNWTVEPPQNKNEPILIFSFLPPLDNYSGEAQALSGTFNLGEGANLAGAKGNFEVNISDITMGLDDLDYEVQNKMLKMGLFPNSTFTFEEIRVKNDRPLQFGQVTHFDAKGIFTMLGIETTLDVPAQIEPVINAEGETRLKVNATFQLPLYEQFKVKGPDGPSPAKDILQFYMQFYLQNS